jgi:glycosyltransferase involved in cell wall biosynthesis
MKIAIIAPTYLPARRANTFQVMKMAQGMVAGGHNVQVAVPAANLQGERPEWEQLASHYGLQHQFPIEWLCAHSRLRRYDFGWRSVFWARHWEAELIYTRLPQAAALASWLGVATIFEVHDLPKGRLGPVVFRQFLRCRGARRLVVISRALLADLVAQLGAPATMPFTIIAPDGIDLARYENLPSPPQARLAINQNMGSDLYLPVNRFTVGYTGHLYPGRGVDLLIELAVRLPNITFLLVGGEQADILHIQNIVTAKGIDNVVLTGFVNNSDLPNFQAASDVLLMPYQSRVEASSGGDISRYLSPMKMFEYLACGRAILSSDLPVLREVLTNENAVLLPPEDVDAWMQAIVLLRDNPERRDALATCAYQHARAYTWEKRVDRILDGIQV